ncbi:MAG: hypothetical protein SGPRY_008853 [Prymnesium sp.]
MTRLRPPWPAQMAQYSRYSGYQLRPCVLEMHSLFRRAATSNLHATRDKYALQCHLEVSHIMPPPLLPPL